MRRATYHNHTFFSDGSDNPQEFLRQAREQHVDVLGFADHYYRESAEATTAPEWAMQPQNLETYYRTLANLRTSTKDVEIRIGLEFDWLDGSAAWLVRPASDPRLDYAIGSVHYVGKDSIDSTRDFWMPLPQNERNEIICRYWKAVREMAESGLFDIAGHLDLVKKFAVYPTCDVTPLVRDALDAIKAADMAIELNTSGWSKECRECYPSEAILRAAFHREIPVTLSADAHRAVNLRAHFARGTDMLKRVGYREIARFEKRERILEPLD